MICITEVPEIKYPSELIAGKRECVMKMLLEESGNLDGSHVSKISEADLRIMYELYDIVFFNDWFRDNFKGKMKFSLSKRMTKSAGLTLCPRNVAAIRPEELTIEIRIGIDLIFQYGEIGGSKPVCGIRTDNNLEALMLVFEHELCHAFEFINYSKSSCKGKRFRTIAGNIFGHTERYHTLPTIKQIAGRKTFRRAGDAVKFDFRGKELSGIIYSINKRAAVLVRDKDGRYTDRKGNFYSKYYIPLEELK